MKGRSRDINTDDNTANKSPNYIYLPFLKSECSENTLNRARKFKEKNSTTSESENKTYKFIIYRKDTLSNLPPKSKLYVAGLGIDLSSEKLDRSILEHIPGNQHIYSISGGKKAITVETLVKRMVEDGLLESDNLTIKLWFGDCDNKASLMADEFTNRLQDYHSKNTFTIDYYPNAILYPPSTHGGKKHKWAVDMQSGERIMASKVRQSLFFDAKSFPEKKVTISQPDIVDRFFDTVTSWIPKWS